MLQYPFLITYPKARDNLYNKEETDLHSNLITESKVTDCNRISLYHVMFSQKSMSQDGITPQSLFFNNMCALLMSGHISVISDACSGQDVWRPVHSYCRGL